MIVTLQHTHARYDSWKTIELLLCEVDTTEEAFAEMRRFLEINNIPSDCTSVSVKEEHVRIGRLIPTHTEVMMWLDCNDFVREYSIGGVIFGLWEDAHRPRYEELGAPEAYNLKYNGVAQGIFEFRNRSDEWYNCATRYFNDLRSRRAGDKECH